MKTIQDILKARKKHLHTTHDKKHPVHNDFHAPIFERPLFCKKDIKLSAIAAALHARTSNPVMKEAKTKAEPAEAKVHPPQAKPPSTAMSGADRLHDGRIKISSLPFFRARRNLGTENSNATEDDQTGTTDATDKERIARLRELLDDVIKHPGMMTPNMFWILFMKIAPHFGMMTAGCVRISALFWLMLSYLKAKNKTKKRKLKEQLVAAVELLEKEEEAMTARMKRR